MPTDSQTVRSLALALHGTTGAAHFDRTAFRARRIFATLPADGQTANLCLTPDQQDHWCALLPRSLKPVAGKWGSQGWTTLDLATLTREDAEILLRLAWQQAGGKP